MFVEALVEDKELQMVVDIGVLQVQRGPRHMTGLRSVKGDLGFKAIWEAVECQCVDKGRDVATHRQWKE